MLVPNQKVKVKWNGANKKHYESFGYIFTQSGEEIEVDVNHLTKSSKAIIKLLCDWCNKEFKREYYVSSKSDHDFCNHHCYGEHSVFQVEQEKPIRKCDLCGEDYKVNKHRFDTSKFCSNECRSKAHSENMQGNKNPNYIERGMVNCDNCNVQIEREKWRITNNTYNFCNVECRRQWFKEIYVKTDEFIERNTQLLLNNLTEGKISVTKSKPQLIINELLSKKGIQFTNEKVYGGYSFDIYLNDYDLLIEVNGGFWHCDNRLYDEINYDIQLNRIMNDTKKKSFIKNNHNKNILYLWEMDIETNLEVCDLLIDKFISNKGLLENYHSFNFFVFDNNQIHLEKNLILPYMDWEFKELSKIIDLNVKKSIGQYKPEKHLK